MLGINPPDMSGKKTRLTFRIAEDLKKKLEQMAASEGRSVAQICEAFLRAGLVCSKEKEQNTFDGLFLDRRASH